jgi:alternate signal-mediated exported protein
MKKMTKGAIVTGLGVALLLGGGGTLAVWNATDGAEAGTIAAGDLNLDAKPGKWTSSLSGGIENIADYRVIPGEELTFTQAVDVTMVGDNLEADLAVTGVNAINDTFGSGTLTVKSYSIKDSSGTQVVNAQKGLQTEVVDGEYTASATFAFDATERQSTGATLNLSGIGYQLTQRNPNA